MIQQNLSRLLMLLKSKQVNTLEQQKGEEMYLLYLRHTGTLAADEEESCARKWALSPQPVKDLFRICLIIFC